MVIYWYLYIMVLENCGGIKGLVYKAGSRLTKIHCMYILLIIVLYRDISAQEKNILTNLTDYVLSS